MFNATSPVAADGSALSAAVDERLSELRDTEAVLKKREASITAEKDALAQRETEVSHRIANVEAAEKRIAEGKRELKATISVANQALADREKNLAERELRFETERRRILAALPALGD